MRIVTRRRVGALLWIVGVAIALVWGFVRTQAGPSVVGVARSVVVQVHAEEQGRLASLDVDLHDSVSAGQVLAKMDPGPMERLREIHAAELLAVAGPAPSDLDSELDAARDRAKLLAKRAELAAIDAELDALRRLVADGAASKGEVERLESRRARVVASLARADRPDDVTATNPWHVVAAAKRLDDIDARIQALELRATMGGTVTAVLRRPGEYIRPGDPILEVRQPTTREVVAWAPVAVAVEAGQSTTVVRADGSELAAAVVSVGPGPTLQPPRTWVDPRREEWGVAVRLRLDGDAVLHPEEPVVVRL